MSRRAVACSLQICDVTGPLHRQHTLPMYSTSQTIYSCNRCAATRTPHRSDPAVPGPSWCNWWQSLRWVRLSSHSTRMWTHRQHDIQPSREKGIQLLLGLQNYYYLTFISYRHTVKRAMASLIHSTGAKLRLNFAALVLQANPIEFSLHVHF